MCLIATAMVSLKFRSLTEVLVVPNVLSQLQVMAIKCDSRWALAYLREEVGSGDVVAIVLPQRINEAAVDTNTVQSINEAQRI